MEYSELHQTKISGSGKVTLPGYGSLKISGSGRVGEDSIDTSGSSVIPGGLVLQHLKTSGSTRIEGDIKADYIKFSGSAHIEGNLECEELIKSGSVTVDGELKVRYARSSGSSKVSKGGYIERELESSGSTMFGGDLVSEDRILYSGVLRVDGAVKAKSYEARLSHDESFIRDGITADFINIQRSHSDWLERGTLYTADIIGDDVTLESVECNNVSGKNITILGGCLIKGKVTYTDNIQVDPKSRLDNPPEKTE